MEMTLNVRISLTPTLERLLSGLVQSLQPMEEIKPAAVFPVAQAEAEKPQPKPQAEAEKPQPQPQPQPEAEAEKPQPQAETHAPGETPDSVLKMAMAETLARIVGADWEKTTDPRKVALRKQTSRCFRQIAAAAQENCQRPTDLEGTERRQKFCVELNNITVKTNDKGEATEAEWLPF